jgi:Tol biopolymer transport system component
MDLKTELEQAARSIAEHIETDGVFEQVVRREGEKRRLAALSRSIVILLALVLAGSGIYGLVRAISPDHRPRTGAVPTAEQIAVVRSEPSLGPSVVSQINILDINGGGTGSPGPTIVRHAPTGNSDDQPSWSPDGSQIAFVTGAPTALGGSAGNGDIFIMNSDGTGARQLSSGGNSAYPTWSPDGSQIAFVRDQGTSLVIVNVSDGKAVQTIAPGVHLGAPSWGRVGSILFTMASEGNGQVYRIQPDGTDMVELTNGFDDGSPVWSPDGASIAFSRSDPRDPSDTSELYVMHADGTGIRRLTTCTAPDCIGDGDPSWSPDGARVAFTRQGNGGNRVDIYVVRADGTELSAVTSGPDWWSSPAWRP